MKMSAGAANGAMKFHHPGTPPTFLRSMQTKVETSLVASPPESSTHTHARALAVAAGPSAPPALAAGMAKGKLHGKAVPKIKNKIKRVQVYQKFKKEGEKEQHKARRARQKEAEELGAAQHPLSPGAAGRRRRGGADGAPAR